MAMNDTHKEQVKKTCSGNGWDNGNTTSAPNNQAMSGGNSTIEQKCNAATEGMNDVD